MAWLLRMMLMPAFRISLSSASSRAEHFAASAALPFPVASSIFWYSSMMTMVRLSLGNSPLCTFLLM